MIRTAAEYRASLRDGRQTGLDKQPAVQEKLAQLACYRETINAHLTASIALAEKSPSGLLMPNQSLLFTGRIHACSQLPAMMHLARDMLNSDYGGHKVTFELFAQSPPFAHLAAVYRNFDFEGPLDFVRKAAGLSARVMGKKK